MSPSDHVSLDRQAWLLTIELEPELFAGRSIDRIDPKPVRKRKGEAGHWFKATSIAAWQRLPIGNRRQSEPAVGCWQPASLCGDISRLSPTFIGRTARTCGDWPKNICCFGKKAGAIAKSVSPLTITMKPFSLTEFNGTRNCRTAASCVVGRPTAIGSANNCALPDLTRPLLFPFYGLLFGVAAWFFLWNSAGTLLIPLGVVAGVLFGYRRRGETLVASRFRRCREHDPTNTPRLRTIRRL